MESRGGPSQAQSTPAIARAALLRPPCRRARAPVDQGGEVRAREGRAEDVRQVRGSGTDRRRRRARAGLRGCGRGRARGVESVGARSPSSGGRCEKESREVLVSTSSEPLHCISRKQAPHKRGATMRIGVGTGKRGALDGCRILWLERPGSRQRGRVNFSFLCRRRRGDGRKATA